MVMTTFSPRSMLLERRRDLPLRNLRQMQQLRRDNKMIASTGTYDRKQGRRRANREMRQVFTSETFQQAERDMLALLESPVKVMNPPLQQVA